MKHVLDAALTIVTRLGDYQFDPPLDSETRDEIMAYAIGAVGRRGSERLGRLRKRRASA